MYEMASACTGSDGGAAESGAGSGDSHAKESRLPGVTIELFRWHPSELGAQRLPATAFERSLGGTALCTHLGEEQRIV